MSIPSPQRSTRRALLKTLGALPGAYAWAHWGPRPCQEARTLTPPPAGATVIALDLSRSMGLYQCLETARAHACALVQWFTAQHPPQVVFVLGMEDYAYPLAPADLPTVTWGSRYPGTNVQHALQLARQLLQPYPPHARQVLLLTDGEVNAYLQDDGSVYFNCPTTWTTIERTLEAVDACAQAHIRVYPLLFSNPDPLATRFGTEVAARTGGAMIAVAPQQPVEATLAAYRTAVLAHAHAATPTLGVYPYDA